MTYVAIGIDFGTSYTKAAARIEDGSVVALSQVRSPAFGTEHSGRLPRAVAWWKCFKDVLACLNSTLANRQLRVSSICVSGISPTLVAFDASQPDRAFAVLYSSLADREDGQSLSQRDPELTARRLAVLRTVSRNERFVAPCMTDLVGYVNWRLTGHLTLNGLSLAEMGIFCKGRSCDEIAITDCIAPRIVAPAEQIGSVIPASAAELGIDAGIPVCGGCSDTLGSIVGAGLVHASETMLYLGTFGSLLLLETDVSLLLNSAYCLSSPYQWLLSVPRFGPTIETLSHQWFGACTEEALRLLDQAAEKSRPGADGTLFLLPRWKNGLNEVGTFEIVAGRSGDAGDISRRARSVLEGLAYAVLALGVRSKVPMRTSGGGARSHIWLSALCTVLQQEIRSSDMSWEATGTADIASRLLWKDTSPVRSIYVASPQPHLDEEVIDDNLHRIKELYREHDWL
jgi:xylulokinase